MESLSRVNSAVCASTSRPSAVMIADSRCKQVFGKRAYSSSSSPPIQGRHHPKIVASVREIAKVTGSKVDGSRITGTTLEAPADVLTADRLATSEKGCLTNPSFNQVLKAIATVAVAADKQRRQEELAGKTDVSVDALRQGRVVDSGRVYRQTFVIRSYEVGANRTASIETLMNLFQEVALNHVWISGLAGDGFGATHAMMRKNLIWVVTRMQIHIERYPEWCEVVEIDTWVTASGKNGLRRDWLLRDYNSGQILARATSTWVMMNRCTRRISKMPDEVRTEISPYFLERSALLEKTAQKVTKLSEAAEYVRSGLTPRRSDLDMNQHVNNVKYVGWILESLPAPIAESHDLTTMILEYRRECGQSDVVQSMTNPESLTSTADDVISDTLFTYSPGTLALGPDMTNPTPTLGPLQYTHLLRFQADGSEIVRGRTVWRIKNKSTRSHHDP